nr:hypothetical protein BdHM001_14880 [Bdellovibrio sp. HM001]BFD66656.1 hypothetical protein HAGR004_16780 [Bdellovibrio sp. HAGR004]
MAYVYLAAAIIFEVFGTITMKYSEGFTKVLPSVLTVACHGICFISLTVALKYLPVSNVYAIWAGVGTALMAFLGLVIFNEPLPLQKVLATSLIILGVVMLNLGDGKKAEEQVAKVEAPSMKAIPAAVVPTVHVDPPRNAG